MSLILDALNRADEERKNQDRVPDLHAHHALPIAKAETLLPGRALALAAVAATLALGLGLGWYLFGRGQEEPVVEHAADNRASTPAAANGLLDSSKPLLSDSPTADSPSLNKDTVPGAGQTSVSQPLPAPTGGSATSAVTDPGQAQRQAVAGLYAGQPASDSQAADNSVDELYASAPAEATQVEHLPESLAENTPREALVPQRITGPAPTPVIRRLDSIIDAPYFKDLPWSQKQQIPTISYARHNYLPNGISTVVINGETRGIGNQVAQGRLVIEDIVEDGVVLRLGSLRFKLPALSGWVNM